MDELEVHPVTPDRWDDLELLFGPNGAYSGCWCMFLRESAKDFDANCVNGGGANRSLLREIVDHTSCSSWRILGASSAGAGGGVPERTSFTPSTSKTSTE